MMYIKRQLLVLIYSLSSFQCCSCFLPMIEFAVMDGKISRSSLQYKNKDDYEMSTERRRLTVPVIGPLPKSTPLIIGDEMEIMEPTPMQWSSLEESAITYMERKDNDGSTTIDGAPIVAIIDAVSGSNTNNGIMKGRYATLAAVIGVRSNNNQFSESEDTFMGHIARIRSLGDSDLYVNGSVRLVGIGRILLGDLFYKIPSKMNDDVCEINDEQDEQDEHDDDYSDYDEACAPIIMANFKFIHDNGVRSNEEWQVGQKSRFTSPIHAINRLNTAANKAERIHKERRDLVAGVTAGKVRLRNAQLRLEEDLYDYDGLGMIGEPKEEFESERYEEVKMEVLDKLFTLEDAVRAQAQAQAQAQEVDNDNLIKSENEDKNSISRMKNYGLSYYSGFSTLSKLTDQAMNTLDPYYSPEFKEKEEYWYEVFGFVAWRALQWYAKPEDVAWALKCTSSEQRLERACEIFEEHRELLKDLASEVNDELSECGEECTDLW